MRKNPCLAPASEPHFSKTSIVKKLVSGLLTTLTLAAGILFFGSASSKPSHRLRPTLTAKTATKMVTGLSRNRGAFNKAISMLAEGAEANPRLAHYYNRVSKRVSRKPVNGENKSGIAVAKSLNASGPAVNNAAVATSEQGVPSGIAYEALVAQDIARPESGSEAQVSRSYENKADGERGAATRYTVGDIDFDTNAAVDRWMNYYSATPIGRSTMIIGIGRSHSYLEMARAEFRDAGVPEDLVWLAFVESVWNPRAVSPAAAGGIWQFIPSTATDYGLTVEAGNDERSDPLKQTRVAAAYLRDLHTLFGDWSLAMAAYNSGEPRVMGAIVKNGRADFWDLCDKELLPKETRDYVPKILAAIKVASQAEGYGLTPPINAGVSASG